MNDNYRHQKESYQQKKIGKILQKMGGINQRIPRIRNKDSKYEPRGAKQYMKELAIRWEIAFIY
jgi:hypothetical protein